MDSRLNIHSNAKVKRVSKGHNLRCRIAAESKLSINPVTKHLGQIQPRRWLQPLCL